MKAFWAWIVEAFDTLIGVFKDPNGKLSSKRLIAIAAAVVSIRQFIVGDWFGGLILLAGAVALGVISAITKT